MSIATTVVPVRREPELLGQTVVVIGGSAGIGLEAARRAGAEGARLINHVSGATVQTDNHCQQMIWEAQAGLGAFHAAVRQLYGEAIAHRAGDYWLEELTLLNTDLSPRWRAITVLAANRLAQSLGFARISQ